MCYEDQIEHHIEGTGYWHPWDHQHLNYDPATPLLTLEIPEASRSGQLSWSFSQDPDPSPFVTPRHHLSDSESEDSNKPEQSTRTPLVLQAPVLAAHQEEEEVPLTLGEQAYLQILQQAADTPKPQALQLIEEAIEAVVAEEPEIHVPAPAPAPVHYHITPLCLIWCVLLFCTYILPLSCTTSIYCLLDTYPRLPKSWYLAAIR